jgi:NAD(P)-dependent dehydrogenase (short-subunit alcohol dehydrogenase family)
MAVLVHKGEEDGMSRKTWLITGCSSGLGQELTRQLLTGGDNLVVTARDPVKLTALIAGHEERALALQLDVTVPSQIDAVVAAAFQRFGAIDVLVNNAGYGHLGVVEDVALDEIYRLFETNFFGPARLIKAVLPAMRKRRSGQIVNIASVGGLVGFPGSGYYCATKFGIVGLTESLRAEVEPFGIRVTVVEPGPFNTDFSNRSLVVTPPTVAEYDIAEGFERAGIADWATRGADPAQGVRAMIEALSSEAPPLHLVIGAAGVETVLARMHTQISELERWAPLGRLSGAPPPRA